MDMSPIHVSSGIVSLQNLQSTLWNILWKSNCVFVVLTLRGWKVWALAELLYTESFWGKYSHLALVLLLCLFTVQCLYKHQLTTQRWREEFQVCLHGFGIENEGFLKGRYYIDITSKLFTNVSQESKICGSIYDFNPFSSSLWRFIKWIEKLYCCIFVSLYLCLIYMYTCLCVCTCIIAWMWRSGEKLHVFCMGLGDPNSGLQTCSANAFTWRSIFLAHRKFYLLLMLLYSATKQSEYTFLVSYWKHFSCLTFLFITWGCIQHERLENLPHNQGIYL